MPITKLVNNLSKSKYASGFKQQKLPAIRQRCSVLQTIIFYFILSIIFFACAGVCFYLAYIHPPDFVLDYTDCKSPTGAVCGRLLARDNNNPTQRNVSCQCIVNITLSKEHVEAGKNGDLLVLYQLDNFYQNVRMYKQSIDWKQLRGENKFGKEGCEKDMKKTNRATYWKNNGKPVYPCGRLPNSFFTDTFAVAPPLSLSESKLTWTSDMARVKKFPLKRGETLQSVFAKPTDWHPDFYKEFVNGKGVKSERFILWLKTAALENFRKRYAWLKIAPRGKEGKYPVTINYRYDVVSFKGRKKLVISKNPNDFPVDYFFFWGFVAIGGMCFLLGPTLLIVSRIIRAVHKPRKLSSHEGDPTSSENNQDAHFDSVEPTPTESIT